MRIVMLTGLLLLICSTTVHAGVIRTPHHYGLQCAASAFMPQYSGNFHSL